MEIEVTLENVGAYLHNAVHQFCYENGLFDDGVDIEFLSKVKGGRIMRMVKFSQLNGSGMTFKKEERV